MRKSILAIIVLSFTSVSQPVIKEPKSINIIAYYAGNESKIEEYPVEKLTHIIYSFCHLKENRLAVDNDADSLTIKKLVSLKSANPRLKVLLSLGGWGGCKNCSEVFSTARGRKDFAASAKELTDYFHTDGIDLDWEYPAIEGYPGHQYMPSDKHNFTLLVKKLRKVLGRQHEISFAAGGFQKFFLESIEWNKAMPLVNRVNLMTYDIVSGYSTLTGHHTPLYSTASQQGSADYAVHFLDSIGVPKNKMVIGAAFYARSWQNVENINNGLYQPGTFKSFIPYRVFEQRLNADSGFIFYRDSEAAAPYAYSSAKKTFATFDDSLSIKLKTEYAIKNRLDGIMFWELTLDKPTGGLLDVIFAAKSSFTD